MSDKVLILVNGGCVDVDCKPDNIEIEIRDYDVEGSWDEENLSCKTDCDGDCYQEMIFPATKIKFSANGKQCFTDVEKKYKSNYKCNKCNAKWSDIYDCMCDGRCPKCDALVSPYKLEKIKD